MATMMNIHICKFLFLQSLVLLLPCGTDTCKSGLFASQSQPFYIAIRSLSHGKAACSPFTNVDPGPYVVQMYEKMTIKFTAKINTACQRQTV